jgi:hypothetical protein
MASNENTAKSAAREESAIFRRATLLAVRVLGVGSVAALGMLTL